MYNKYWPADVHIIGKDILRFHTIYWPIMLMALGEPLPKQVFGHPWMLVGDEKMSKSRGNVIYAEDLVKHFGVDAVRYLSLIHILPVLVRRQGVDFILYVRRLFRLPIKI